MICLRPIRKRRGRRRPSLAIRPIGIASAYRSHPERVAARNRGLRAPSRCSIEPSRLKWATDSTHPWMKVGAQVTVSIWAGFIVVARFGIRTSLTPWDITAIRFAVSGSLLLPYAIHKGLALDRLGWTGLAAVVAGCGAPMVLLANAGLLFAPAAHAGALFRGVTPLMVALLAATILREAFTSQKRIGCTLIVIGVISICLRRRWQHRNYPEHRTSTLSLRGIGLGLLHRRHAARTARWRPRRLTRGYQLVGAVFADLHVFC